MLKFYRWDFCWTWISHWNNHNQVVWTLYLNLLTIVLKPALGSTMWCYSLDKPFHFLCFSCVIFLKKAKANYEILIKMFWSFHKKLLLLKIVIVLWMTNLFKSFFFWSKAQCKAVLLKLSYTLEITWASY